MADDCAILAIASSIEIVLELLEKFVKDVVLDDQTSAVPWTIANKYYTAEVKFLVHPLSSLSSIQVEILAPALLFVWIKGEPYRDQIRCLSRQISQHEFDVVLAIRLSRANATSSVEIDDDDDVDAYIASQGFEFVDVPYIEASSPSRTGIPGIPRIVDALSTIMWPSMIRQTSKRATTAGFIGAMGSNQRNCSDDYHDLMRLIGEKTSGNDSHRVQRELEELERWLDQDMSLSGDVDADHGGVPWSTIATPEIPSPSGFAEKSCAATPEACFDDDFTSFVSASSANYATPPSASSETLSSPPRVALLVSTNFSSTFSFNSSSGCSTPIFEDHADLDATRLAPGESYKSLGSVSDLGDPDREAINLDWLPNGSDEGGNDVLSRVEITETSPRTVGPPLSQERGDENFEARSGPGTHSHLGEEVAFEADLERFDLQAMLNALRGLKEEISGMPDKERRQAAARVALSLAYGLSQS